MKARREEQEGGAIAALAFICSSGDDTGTVHTGLKGDLMDGRWSTGQRGQVDGETSPPSDCVCRNGQPGGALLSQQRWGSHLAGEPVGSS